MNTIVAIDGMTCAHCVARVTNALSGVRGVTRVKVDLKTNEAKVQTSGASDTEIRLAVENAGYSVKSIQTV